MASSPSPLIRVPPDFEDEFPHASARATECTLNLAVTAWALERVGTAVIASHGLTSMAAFNVLTVLHGADEPMGPSTLADRMVVTRATMTGVIDALERRGLIRRRAHVADGRRQLIEITDEGRSIIDGALPHIHAVERDVFACLTEREQATLLRLVAKVSAHLADLPQA